MAPKPKPSSRIAPSPDSGSPTPASPGGPPTPGERCIARRKWWTCSGAAQRGDFDVLLVGYVSRWQRNLRRTLELLEDTLHPAGVPVYFCDEEILSSSERNWDQLVEEAKDAERYSRQLSRRIKEGYASKLAKERDPGGHPPFGFRRNAAKLLEPDPDRLPTVHRVFELAAGGLADRAVATAVGLPLFTVRGILTSPLYIGRLRDGEPARWAPLVPGSHWEAAQAKRARRATNTSRPADPRRPYALDMLHCAACGKPAHRRHRLLPPSRTVPTLRCRAACAPRTRPDPWARLPPRDVRADRRGASHRGLGWRLGDRRHGRRGEPGRISPRSIGSRSNRS